VPNLHQLTSHSTKTCSTAWRSYGEHIITLTSLQPIYTVFFTARRITCKRSVHVVVIIVSAATASTC